MAPDLSIKGTSEQVRPVDAELFSTWSSYGQDGKGHRYSSAAQINANNVDRLEIAWSFQSGAFEGKGDAARRSAFEVTPILVEEQLVLCTQFNEVISLNPGTGEENWRHDSMIPLDGHPANQFTCRGVSYWQDKDVSEATTCASRIFMGTVDASKPG